MKNSIISKIYDVIFECEKNNIEVFSLRESLSLFFSGKITQENLERNLNLFYLSSVEKEEVPLEQEETNKIILEFQNSCSSKPFWKELTKFLYLSLEDEENLNLSEISLAKALSSFLTHVLIQVEKQEDSYVTLGGADLSFQLHSFICGELSVEDLQNWLKETYDFLSIKNSDFTIN